jgi:hypothetical protein
VAQGEQPPNPVALPRIASRSECLREGDAAGRGLAALPYTLAHTSVMLIGPGPNTVSLVELDRLRTAAESIVGQKRWTHIHLTVSPEEFFELLRRGRRSRSAAVSAA